MAGAPKADDIGDVMTQCTCKINKTDFTVTLTNRYLRWQAKKDLHTVRMLDILSASLQSSSKRSSDSDSVRICYVKQGKKSKLTLCSVVFVCSDLQLVTKLHQQINDLLKRIPQRPKKLLVLINPVSGRSRGRTVYAQKVAPIFQESSIETDVIVTERAHHTEEILSTYDTSKIDGLVLVGGDGLYHEAVNGLLQKLSKEQGLNVDYPDITLPEIDLRIGLIPCGTGNGIAAACYGNYDVTTAALSVVIGHQMESNVISVHSGGRLVAYSILLVGYGLWGDMINTAESRRNQGVLRYPIAMLQHIFLKPFRRLNISIRTVVVSDEPNVKDYVGTEPDDKSCDTGYVKDEQNAGKTQVTEKSNQEVTRNEEIIGATVFLLHPESLFSGVQSDLSYLSMLLNKPTQRRKFFTFMFNLMIQNYGNLERREDIIMLPGSQWTVQLHEPSDAESENGRLEHILNIDGEVFKLPLTEFVARLLPQKVNLFSNTLFATQREKSQ